MTKINVTYISDPTRYYWLDGKLTAFDIVANFRGWDLDSDRPEVWDGDPTSEEVENV